MYEYGSISELKYEHPDLKYYKSATRKSDGKVFKIGDEIQFLNEALDEDGNMPSYTVVAFDHYDHPKFGKVKRAITHWAGMFSFNCLHDIDLLRTIFDRQVIVEKYKKKLKRKTR